VYAGSAARAGAWASNSSQLGMRPILSAPEGNEFCVVPTDPVQFDDDGRTNYLDGLQL
jgi:hypothetical protein